MKQKKEKDLGNCVSFAEGFILFCGLCVFWCVVCVVFVCVFFFRQSHDVCLFLAFSFILMSKG